MVRGSEFGVEGLWPCFGCYKGALPFLGGRTLPHPLCFGEGSPRDPCKAITGLGFRVSPTTSRVITSLHVAAESHEASCRSLNPSRVFRYPIP